MKYLKRKKKLLLEGNLQILIITIILIIILIMIIIKVFANILYNNNYKEYNFKKVQ